MFHDILHTCDFEVIGFDRSVSLHVQAIISLARDEESRIHQKEYPWFILRVYGYARLPALVRLLKSYQGESVEDAELPGPRDRLGTIGDIEFAVNTAGMGLGGSDSYDKLLGDLLVGPAQGQKLEHLQLALA